MDIWVEDKKSVPALAVIDNGIDVIAILGGDFGPDLLHLGTGDFLLSCVVTVVIHHISFHVVFSLFLEDEDTVDHQLIYEGNEQEGLTQAKTS